MLCYSPLPLIKNIGNLREYFHSLEYKCDKCYQFYTFYGYFQASNSRRGQHVVSFFTEVHPLIAWPMYIKQLLRCESTLDWTKIIIKKKHEQENIHGIWEELNDLDIWLAERPSANTSGSRMSNKYVQLNNVCYANMSQLVKCSDLSSVANIILNVYYKTKWRLAWKWCQNYRKIYHNGNSTLASRWVLETWFK